MHPKTEKIGIPSNVLDLDSVVFGRETQHQVDGSFHNVGINGRVSVFSDHDNVQRLDYATETTRVMGNSELRCSL
jgi:hypothetical protein